MGSLKTTNIKIDIYLLGTSSCHRVLSVPTWDLNGHWMQSSYTMLFYLFILTIDIRSNDRLIQFEDRFFFISITENQTILIFININHHLIN